MMSDVTLAIIEQIVKEHFQTPGEPKDHTQAMSCNSGYVVFI